jgi:retron-type reverse transcriptase
MGLLAKRIQDKPFLRLISKYLEAGIMANGIKLETVRGGGGSQGGLLSPLLSNIMLDLLDKELERRRLRFVRSADDCNIYVKS